MANGNIQISWLHLVIMVIVLIGSVITAFWVQSGTAATERAVLSERQHTLCNRVDRFEITIEDVSDNQHKILKKLDSLIIVLDK